jgi:hypothetical protein
VIKRNRFLDDPAQLLEDGNFIGAVAPAVNQPPSARSAVTSHVPSRVPMLMLTRPLN